MAVDQKNVGENVRRLAGMHDVTLGQLAAWVDLSRAGMMKIVDRNHPSKPKTENLLKLAAAFSITPNDLLAEPTTALQAAVRSWIEHGDPPVTRDQSATPIRKDGSRRNV